MPPRQLYQQKVQQLSNIAAVQLAVSPILSAEQFVKTKAETSDQTSKESLSKEISVIFTQQNEDRRDQKSQFAMQIQSQRESLSQEVAEKAEPLGAAGN